MLPAKSPQKHCSEEQLLAFLDGELRPDARRGVQDHLSRCWQCRGRMADLESRAHDMAELLADFAFLGHSRIAAAKEKFLASVKKSSPANDAGQSFSRLILLGSNPLCGRRPPLRPISFAAGLVAAGMIAFFAYDSYRPDSIKAVSAAVRVESSLLGHPVHQQFALQFVEYRPRPAQSSSQLEIWSDPVHRRFASEWKKEHGAREYAVWQPDSARRYRYDQGRMASVPMPEAPPQRQSPLYSCAVSTSSLENLQSHFKAWVSTRAWQPLLLARDFSLFINQQGVLLRSEMKVVDGTRLLIVTARASQPGETMTMTLELDPETQQTRAQEVRLESPAREFALRVVPESMEAIPEARLRLAVFTPDASAVPPARQTGRPFRTTIIQSKVRAYRPSTSLNSFPLALYGSRRLAKGNGI
jgi:hypothetical protein